MIQPNEMRPGLPMTISNGVIATTTEVWSIQQ